MVFERRIQDMKIVDKNKFFAHSGGRQKHTLLPNTVDLQMLAADNTEKSVYRCQAKFVKKCFFEVLRLWITFCVCKKLLALGYRQAFRLRRLSKGMRTQNFCALTLKNMLAERM